jgi:iron complex outermembrane receptor protein
MNYLRLSLSIGLLSFTFFAEAQKKSDTTLLQPIEINTVRASDNTPVTKTNISKSEIEKRNFGFDLPFILNQTPSVQVTSDAGNGIGYTGIRIRGTDATRINVTINGIPYNDAESQGTYFVDLPDIASSSNSIQIQRGVGTSTNGAGSFGGSININTNDIDSNKNFTLSNSIGSYQSYKATLIANSGLINKHFIFTGRLSNINSNGYVDRAKTKLQSYFASAIYVDSKQSLRLNTFSGKEKTYAAWFGINAATLDTNRTYNPAGTEKTGDPYENETDNYTQTHYQLFYNRKINERLKFNVALFLTKGKGYFEQYKAGQYFSSYGLPDYINSNNDTISTSDLVRQLWLDNNFYGTIFSLQYAKNKTNFIFGGGYNKYDGLHFGEIVNAQINQAIPDHYRWYSKDATKNDFSFYTKWNQKINDNWQSYVDLQVRTVNYLINGFKNNPQLFVNNKYTFFNPKVGFTYIKDNQKFYISYAKSSKEPNREDFEANTNQIPKQETLHDFELGYEQNNKKSNYVMNIFCMLYKNQLVLTGKINDVFAYTRTNIDHSFRLGLELQGSTTINKWLALNANFTLSANKLKDFYEYIDNYDDASGIQQKNYYQSSDISYSPSVIGGASIIVKATKEFEITLNSKYIGRQFLDNTSNKNRILPDYFTQDARFNYNFKLKNRTKINLFLQANNLFSKKYVSNGYTFSYIYGGEFNTENYYYPMATFNVMGGLSITL